MNINQLEKIMCRIHANPYFGWTTVIIILISSLTLGIKTYNLSPSIVFAIYILDWVVTVYFLTEIIIRIIASGGIKPFFRQGGWNVFDFIIVVVSFIPVDESQNALLARLLRLFRVMRVVYFIPELREIITSLLISLPRIAYVALMMFIIFYMYGVAGTLFFEEINPQLWGDVGIAMLTLFRVATFEDWTDVMYETMAVYPLSWLFYLSFIFFAAFVFLNMMIGVIITSMTESANNDEPLQKIEQRLEGIEKQLTELNKK